MMKSLFMQLVILITILIGSSARSEAQTNEAIRYSATVEDQIVQLTNEARRQHGLQGLMPQPRLVDAARLHSVEMITRDYFEHTSPTPGLTNPWDRVFRMGIQTYQVSENIFEADGYPLAEIAMDCLMDWMSSDGHRENILNPTSTCVGVGAAIHPSTSCRGFEILITQEFTGPIVASR